MSLRRSAELYNNSRGQVIVDNIVGQRGAFCPFFCLTWGHAAIVLFGEAGRTMTAMIFFYVMVADDLPLLVIEIDI